VVVPKKLVLEGGAVPKSSVFDEVAGFPHKLDNEVVGTPPPNKP
jgi:hypothetical protein